MKLIGVVEDGGTSIEMRNEINRGMNFRYFKKNIKNSKNKGRNFRY